MFRRLVLSLRDEETTLLCAEGVTFLYGEGNTVPCEVVSGTLRGDVSGTWRGDVSGTPRGMTLLGGAGPEGTLFCGGGVTLF